MSDLKKYVADRKGRDREFAERFDEGYARFKIGATLRKAREAAGLSQEELATRLKTKKPAISRIENHAEDIKLSTLEKVAAALGKRLTVKIASNPGSTMSPQGNSWYCGRQPGLS